jgi:hypothetical protein
MAGGIIFARRRGKEGFTLAENATNGQKKCKKAAAPHGPDSKTWREQAGFPPFPFPYLVLSQRPQLTSKRHAP